MACSGEVLRQLKKTRAGGGADGGVDISYPVLVPNLRGLEDALQAGATEIAVFAAASETFSRKNINCGIDESIERFAEVVERALLRAG